MPTKYLFLFITLFLFQGGCSSKNEPSKITHMTINKERSPSCQKEIEETITDLVSAKKLKISKDIFSKDSYLRLTNQKRNILNNSPIFNDMGGRKTLLLYQQEDRLYIGLENRDKNITKNREIKYCEEDKPR